MTTGMLRSPKVIGIVGWKNSGKTTLIESLLPEFTSRNLRVSTIKHAHHALDFDIPGKDSYRHRMSGAHETIVASSARWALIRELRDAPEPTLDELLDRLSPCHLVLVEGFKTHGHAKIEVFRDEAGLSCLADSDPSIIAVATHRMALAGHHHFLPLDDPSAIATFLCNLNIAVRFGSKMSRSKCW